MFAKCLFILRRSAVGENSIVVSIGLTTRNEQTIPVAVAGNKKSSAIGMVPIYGISWQTRDYVPCVPNLNHRLHLSKMFRW
jgi:hypothetical protein